MRRQASLRGVWRALLGLVIVGCMGAMQPAPYPAVVPVPRTEAWWVARHDAKVAEARRGKVDLLYVGDSITQNYEKTGPAPDQVFLPIWDHYFAPHHAMNLGFSGDRTEHLLWRLQHGEVDGLAPKDIVLLIGTNNTGAGQPAPQVAEGVVAVVDELHTRMPKARLLVLDILPTGGSAAKEDADQAIDAIVRAHYQAVGFIRFLDLRALFVKDGVVDTSLFYDPGLNPPRAALHPNTVGQRRMAAAVAEALYGKS